MWRSAVLALFLALAVACSHKSPQIEEAKKKQASGELDHALVDLEVVRTTAPDSPDAAEARRLATSWLLEAAAKETSLDEKKRRLSSALEWSPANGEAGARLCLVLVELGHDEDAEKCLDEGLKGKTGAPDDVIKAARAKLDARKEAEEAKQRTTLLATGRPAQLKLIIDKWPGTPEAAEARKKLAKAESLCADAASYIDDLRTELAALEKVAGDDADAARKQSLAGRLEQFEQIGKDVGGRSRGFRNKGIEAEAHAIKPTEDKLRVVLHDGYWKLADLSGDLGDELRRPEIESDESYDEHASRTLATFAKSLKTAGEKLRKDLTAAADTCKPD